MLHLLYILAFTVLAFLAIGNLIRSMIVIGADIQGNAGSKRNSAQRFAKYGRIPHPELLDDAGNLVDEPLLVMKSIEIDEARQQLDALYRSSPGNSPDHSEPA